MTRTLLRGIPRAVERSFRQAVWAVIRDPYGHSTARVNLRHRHVRFDGSVLDHLGGEGIFKDEVTPVETLLHIAFDELDMMADVRMFDRLMTGMCL